MKIRAVWLVGLIALLIAPLACRPPETELSKEITDEIETLKKQKSVIERKMRELESARVALEKSTAAAADALETIKHAMGEVQKSLETIERLPVTTPARPRRLPLPVSILLVVIIVLSLLTAFRLRSLRVREMRDISSKEVGSEPKSEPSET